MKKIIVNGITLVGEEIYGVQRNATELLYALDKLVSSGSVQVLVPEHGVRKLTFDNIELCVLKNTGNTEGKLFKYKWNYIVFPKYVKNNKGIGVDLILSLPLWGCDVACICDCITEVFPENAKTFLEKIRRRFYLLRVKRIMQYCRKIITISEYSKKELCRIYHCSRERITVVPCAWQHFRRIETDESIINKLGLIKKQYFFALGSRYKHKNFRWIAAAAQQNPQYMFVVSGSNKLNSSDHDLDYTGLSNLLFTGYLSDGEVKGLMVHCRAFIQPSLYEGFGIPPMEAMSVGARCIVANTSSLPEIYGRSVWYIEPLEYENIDMDEIMGKELEAPEIVLSQFSWEKSAQMLLNILVKMD